jgi:hypothetical protein
MEVLLYQIGIFIAISIAGKIGKNARIIAIVLISIFTILQVYMFWLLALQFFTIIFSYIISKSFSNNKKTNSPKNQEPNIEIKQKELKKELNKDLPTEKTREIIKEIKKTEEKQKNISIKKFQERPIYTNEIITKSNRKNLFSINEIHSLNDEIDSDPKTSAKMQTLRSKLSKSHPQFSIIKLNNINRVLGIDGDIHIQGNTIYINPEIVYMQDYLIKTINGYDSNEKSLTYKEGVFQPKRKKEVSCVEETINKSFELLFDELEINSLRFNGVYQSEKGKITYPYLRFYESGLVLSTSSTGTPGQISLWFTEEKYTAPHSSRGTYSLSDRHITFSTESSEGSLKYEGIIENNSLKLNIHSLINGNKSKKTYIFKPFK